MKKYLTLLLFILIATVGLAQSNYQDVVFLKNGNIIRGVIIEQIPNKSIKIETSERNIFVYQLDEIEKITKEQSVDRNRKFKSFKPGYKGIAELGYGIGVGDFGMDKLKLNIVNSYRVNPYLSIGLGTGIHYYTSAKAALTPLFADFRTNFVNNEISPYMSLGIGYTFDASNNFEGTGLLLNPTVGTSFKAFDKSIMHIGLGYELQRMKFYFLSSDYYYDYVNQNSGAISINVGISF